MEALDLRVEYYDEIMVKLQKAKARFEDKNPPEFRAMVDALKVILEMQDDDERTNALYDMAIEASFKVEWLTKKRRRRKHEAGWERMLERAKVKRPRTMFPLAAAAEATAPTAEAGSAARVPEPFLVASRIAALRQQQLEQAQLAQATWAPSATGTPAGLEHPLHCAPSPSDPNPSQASLLQQQMGRQQPPQATSVQAAGYMWAGLEAPLHEHQPPLEPNSTQPAAELFSTQAGSLDNQQMDGCQTGLAQQLTGQLQAPQAIAAPSAGASSAGLEAPRHSLQSPIEANPTQLRAGEFQTVSAGHSTSQQMLAPQANLAAQLPNANLMSQPRGSSPECAVWRSLIQHRVTVTSSGSPAFSFTNSHDATSNSTRNTCRTSSSFERSRRGKPDGGSRAACSTNSFGFR